MTYARFEVENFAKTLSYDLLVDRTKDSYSYGTKSVAYSHKNVPEFQNSAQKVVLDMQKPKDGTHVFRGSAGWRIAKAPGGIFFWSWQKYYKRLRGCNLKSKKNPKMKVILPRGSNLAFMSRKILRKLDDQRGDS